MDEKNMHNLFLKVSKTWEGLNVFGLFFFTNLWHSQNTNIWTKLLFAEHGWIDRGDKEPLAVPEPVSIFPIILSTFWSIIFVFFAPLYWLLSYLILWVYYHLNTCLWNVHVLQHQLLSSQYCIHRQIIFFSNSLRCTMCILSSMFTFQPNTLRHILKVASW